MSGVAAQQIDDLRSEGRQRHRLAEIKVRCNGAANFIRGYRGGNGQGAHPVQVSLDLSSDLCPERMQAIH